MFSIVWSMSILDFPSTNAFMPCDSRMTFFRSSASLDVSICFMIVWAMVLRKTSWSALREGRTTSSITNKEPMLIPLFVVKGYSDVSLVSWAVSKSGPYRSSVEFEIRRARNER